MPKQQSLTIPEHVSQFLTSLNMRPITEVMTMSTDDRFEHAALGDHLELAGILYKGFALMGLKESLGHGEYMAGLASRNIEVTGAWRAQNLAKLSSRVSKSNFAALQNMPATKLQMMVKWDEDELNTFFARAGEVRGITYDQAIEMSTRDLEKSLRDTNRDLQDDLDRTKKENAMLTEQLHTLRIKHSKLEEHVYPPTIDKVRVESSIRGIDIIRQLDELSQLAVDLRHAPDLDEDRDKADSQYDAGAAVLLLNIQNIKARTDYVLREVAGLVGDEHLPQALEDVRLLTQGEITRINQKAQLMALSARAREDHREIERTPRGRGRPRKQVK